MVISSRVHMLKPSAEIYHYLLDHFHLDGNRTLFIDDAPANIEGALRCGIQGLCFNAPGEAEALLRILIRKQVLHFPCISLDGRAKPCYYAKQFHRGVHRPMKGREEQQYPGNPPFSESRVKVQVRQGRPGEGTARSLRPNGASPVGADGRSP